MKGDSKNSRKKGKCRNRPRMKNLKEKYSKLIERKQKMEREYRFLVKFVLDVGENIPDGWTRTYESDKSRYMYENISNKMRFWSDVTDEKLMMKTVIPHLWS